MADWIRDNECLYNKKLSSYKDGQKDKLWSDMATQPDEEVDILQMWYRSMRIRYGKLLKEKSGDGAPEYTEWDEWIMRKFAFLKSHINFMRSGKGQWSVQVCYKLIILCSLQAYF